MKEWLTAREIATEALPGVPATKMGIGLVAEREGWNEHPTFARRRAGRGGGMEYHFRILPTLAQVSYWKRHARVGIVDLPPAANDTPAPDRAPQAEASRKAALERDARMAILKAFEAFKRDGRLGRLSALQIFTDGYNRRSIAVAEWVLPVIPRLTKPTLQRWSLKKRAGISLAVDRSAARKGTGLLDIANGGAVRDFILALIASKPHLAAEELQRQIRFQFGDTLEAISKGVSKTVPYPPVRTIQHFVKRLKAENKALLLAATNPDEFRSKYALSGTGTLRHVTEPNQLWQIDASPIDALCTDGRHSVYACIDIATRRTRWYVSETPKAEAVGLLIRKAVLAWGVPEEIKTDRGSDFIAQATQRLLAALDVEMTLSDAYSPEQKGHVERAIKTFQHMLMEVVPGYVGHSVADRKAIESQKSFAKRLGENDASVFEVALSAAELQDVIDRWSDTLYQHRPHKGLGGMTPFGKAAASAAPIRAVDERALDILLAPVAGKDGIRTVTKFGIQVDNQHYLHEAILPGRQVFVRRDPADIGRVLVFDPVDDRFLGEAVCGELAGIDVRTWLKAKKEARALIIREGLAKIRAETRELLKGPALHERTLAVAARDMPNVVVLPKPEIRHSTPQIAAALDAIAFRTPKPAQPLTGRAADIHAQLKREAAGLPEPAAAPSNVTQIETQKTRWRRALAIEAALETGDRPSEEDLLWLGGYRQDSEYRVMKTMLAEHGEALRF